MQKHIETRVLVRRACFSTGWVSLLKAVTLLILSEPLLAPHCICWCTFMPTPSPPGPVMVKAQWWTLCWGTESCPVESATRPTASWAWRAPTKTKPIWWRRALMRRRASRWVSRCWSGSWCSGDSCAPGSGSLSRISVYQRETFGVSAPSADCKPAGSRSPHGWESGRRLPRPCVLAKVQVCPPSWWFGARRQVRG